MQNVETKKGTRIDIPVQRVSNINCTEQQTGSLLVRKRDFASMTTLFVACQIYTHGLRGRWLDLGLVHTVASTAEHPSTVQLGKNHLRAMIIHCTRPRNATGKNAQNQFRYTSRLCPHDPTESRAGDVAARRNASYAYIDTWWYVRILNVRQKASI